MSGSSKTLIVIAGPTASGKSALALSLAETLGTEIVSADSRQIYRGMPITTAAPTENDLRRVRHHFAVVCGGSMMYLDALCNGIDDIPTVPAEIRTSLQKEHSEKGNTWLLELLEKLDPEYYLKVDKANIKRVFHAVEICITAGVPYTSLLTGQNRRKADHLPWDVVKFGIRMPRAALFDRINRRVEKMVADGMVDEIRSLSHLRHLNSLNTVGVKEIIRYLDGEWDLETATARLAKNTRVYAKKQITWLQRDEDIKWLDTDGHEHTEELTKQITTFLECV